MHLGRWIFSALVLLFLSSCIDSGKGLTPQTNPLGRPSMFVSNSQNSIYHRTAQYVGRANIDNRDSSGFSSAQTCTATQIGQGYFVSAQHCFSSFTNAISIDFNVVEATNRTTRSVSLNRMQVVGDDYGLPLDLIYGRIVGGSTVADPEFPVRLPRVGEPIYILHYPDSGILHVSEKSCRIKSIEGPFLYHDCPTWKGTSGALIFSKDDNAVIGVHTQGFDGPRQGGGYNKGTIFMMLLDGAPRLANLFPKQEARVVPASVFGAITLTSLSAALGAHNTPPIPPLPHPAYIERRLSNNARTKSVIAAAQGSTVINWHSRGQNDCSFVIPRIAFRELPSNGTIRAEIVETTIGAPDAPPELKQYRNCNGRPYQYVQIIYEPNSGYLGVDTVTYDRVTGDRYDVRGTLNIRVGNTPTPPTLPWQ